MKILFVKLGAIGDVVQAAAAVAYFKSQYPASYIEWVVGKQAAPLLNAMEVADKIHVVDDAKLFTGSFLSRLTALLCEIFRLGGFKNTITTGLPSLMAIGVTDY